MKDDLPSVSRLKSSDLINSARGECLIFVTVGHITAINLS